MGESEIEVPQPDESEALALLEQALAILDALEVPADVGAHIDLAVHRLRARTIKCAND